MAPNFALLKYDAVDDRSSVSPEATTTGDSTAGITGDDAVDDRSNVSPGTIVTGDSTAGIGTGDMDVQALLASTDGAGTEDADTDVADADVHTSLDGSRDTDVQASLDGLSMASLETTSLLTDGLRDADVPASVGGSDVPAFLDESSVSPSDGSRDTDVQAVGNAVGGSNVSLKDIGVHSVDGTNDNAVGGSLEAAFLLASIFKLVLVLTVSLLSTHLP